ncbi:MAG: InlB B-repeat-containing protein, partial [Clostridia bacterium]|nr:InlB B-repeat-containing protein [Clostridia bacterium]
MIDIKKIISILLVLCTLLSAIPYSAFALSWDGSSAGGSTNAVNGSSTGYVIRSTSDSACVVGYRFSAVDSSGGMKVTKVIDVYRNTSNGDNAYSTSAKFSTKYNKKQIIANKNAKLTTTYNQTNCYKEKDIGFTTTLPNPSDVEIWQSYEANINKVLSKLGVGSVSNMVYGDKVVIEPLFDVCLAGEYQALTVSEIAYCGRSVLGGSSTGGTSSTSASWGFISNHTNRIWPNKLYTPDGQGLWTAASAIGSSSKETFDNIISKGYGAGIGYNETTNKTYSIKFNGNGSTSGTTASMSMTYGVAKNLTANGFSKTGNVFVGWNTKADGSGTSYTNKQSVNNLTSTHGATVNLYAQWQPYILTVNYHANGGNISSSMFILVDNYVGWQSLGTKVAQETEYDNTVGIFNASRFGLYKTGYITSSWTTKADGGTEVTYDSTKKTSDFASNITTGDRSITLYAKWIPNTYTIKFNGNGNTGGSTANMSMTYDVAKSLTANGFTKTGYVFDGWDTKADGSGTDYSNQQSVKNLTTTNGATITLYAKWKPITYTINFNGNGSTSGSTASMSMTYDVAKNLTANGFAKTGYTFAGWNTKANGSGTSYTNKQSVKNLTTTNGATITLYAQWTPITYTIKFNGNGSTSGSTASMSMTYDVAKNLTANGFAKTGYHFSGWNTKADGSGTSYYNQQSVKNLTTTNGATITLYAQWSTNSYTIAFDGNGNTGGTTSSMTMKFDETKALTANGYTKTGHTFSKWTTKSDGSGTSYTNKQSVKNLTSINGATVYLYAQWTANTYTIKFDGNGATSGSTASMSMTYGVAKNLTANGFARTGHYFNGWNTKADGSGTSYTNKQSVKNLTSTNGATVTLYAQWVPYELKVYYNANGGSINSDTYSLSSNDIYVKSSGSKYYQTWTYNKANSSGLINASTFDIYKTGYTFNKWGTSSSGSTLFDQNDTTITPTMLNSGIASGNVTVKLYAQWTPNTYTIKFFGNTHTGGSTASMSMTYDVAKNLTANGFTKTGYVFAGWNTSADGTGTNYSDKQSVKNLTATNGATINLYAQWKPITYTIKFDGNGA